jgi:acyl-CoA thioester hydrolase
MMHDMPAFLWTTRVRFVDTDASQRIHYTALFRFFEAAEHELFRELGTGYPEMGDRNLAWPRVHAECDISGALVFDDEIQIEVMVDKVGTSSFTLAFRALKGAIECGSGKITIVCMNVAAQKSQAMPPVFAAALRGRM